MRLALDDFTQALKLDPNQADALSYRGLGYQKLGEIDKAIEDFRNYLKLEKEAPDADEVRQRLAQLERERDQRAR
jgi:regulator of sirC expression with transglutaminase-like and TPR domain